MKDCQDYELLKVNLAKRTADSILARDHFLKTKWAYEYGLVLKGIEAVYEQTGDEKYFRFIKDSIDALVSEDGEILGYKPQEYNIDHLNNGKNLIFLEEKTGEARYRKALAQLKYQLETHPRTSEGLFWHKKIYPYQVWLDGIFMGDVFYAQLARTEEEFADVFKQFKGAYEHTKSESGLLHHAWDEKREQPWCDKATGLSEHYWGRSLGWFVMAAADVIEFMPEKYRAELSAMLESVLRALLKYQDEDSRVWYQIVDMGGRKGNYLESSASFMFIYAMAKGARLKYLPAEFADIARDAYKGAIEEFVIEAADGKINLNKTCYVAGLGGAGNRDGSYAYYISEPILTNEPKGVGAFLLACAEMEKL